MNKVIQLSLLAKISGNVNADEVVGTRLTLKKMYNNEGEVLPFISPRAIKYAIRQALKSRGYEIDPFREEGKKSNDSSSQENKKKRQQQLNDAANPRRYIDNDLFGYMRTKEGGSISRQAPIAFSYFKAIQDTTICTDFGVRYPREDDNQDPVPFEIEVAEFIGKLNVIIYDYIGKKGYGLKEEDFTLDDEERKKRLSDFLDIFLTPSYVLPRRSNSLNIPEYIAVLVVLSKNGPKPIYQYFNYQIEDNDRKIDEEKLRLLKELFENSETEIFLVDYGVIKLPPVFEIKKVKEAIKKMVSFYFE